jgi:hypothetical protein
MRPMIIINLLLCFANATFGQDSSMYFIHGRVQDLERKFPIEGANIKISGESGFNIDSTSDHFGNYVINFKAIANPQKKYVIEVYAEGHISTGYKVVLNDEMNLHCDFDLRPSMTSWDLWFPAHFQFESNSVTLDLDDSIDVVLRFSNPESKQILQSYSYNIVTRRSSEESDVIALERGKSLHKLLTEMGIDSEQITIENKSTSDFFYCKYCEGNVYEYLSGQGLDVTQELIDKTTDPKTKEEYESMRRIAQIEMKKLQ